MSFLEAYKEGKTLHEFNQKVGEALQMATAKAFPIKKPFTVTLKVTILAESKERDSFIVVDDVNLKTPSLRRKALKIGEQSGRFFELNPSHKKEGFVLNFEPLNKEIMEQMSWSDEDEED